MLKYPYDGKGLYKLSTKVMLIFSFICSWFRKISNMSLTREGNPHDIAVAYSKSELYTTCKYVKFS
jgi:hypothetical protein